MQEKHVAHAPILQAGVLVPSQDTTTMLPPRAQPLDNSTLLDAALERVGCCIRFQDARFRNRRPRYHLHPGALNSIKSPACEPPSATTTLSLAEREFNSPQTAQKKSQVPRSGASRPGIWRQPLFPFVANSAIKNPRAGSARKWSQLSRR